MAISFIFSTPTGWCDALRCSGEVCGWIPTTQLCLPLTAITAAILRAKRNHCWCPPAQNPFFLDPGNAAGYRLISKLLWKASLLKKLIKEFHLEGWEDEGSIGSKIWDLCHIPSAKRVQRLQHSPPSPCEDARRIWGLCSHSHLTQRPQGFPHGEAATSYIHFSGFQKISF